MKTKVNWKIPLFKIYWGEEGAKAVTEFVCRGKEVFVQDNMNKEDYETRSK